MFNKPTTESFFFTPKFLMDQRWEERSIPEACEENAVMNCYRIRENPRRIERKNNTKSKL
jgi:hypothetical protein